MQERTCVARLGCAAVVGLLVLAAVVRPRAQDGVPDAAHAEAFDQILDVDVRDGYVYYRALKAERSRLDRYVTGLATAPIASAPRSAQVAFWLNAYNALVLRTVIDHYPITQQTRSYPARSIRQIPGAFEREPHHVAGRTLTLDQIEQTVLPGFKDSRVYLALGRGAVGSGRLRSEAFTAESLERQLSEAASECLNHAQCMQVDRTGNRMLVSSIFSWRRAEFIEGYGEKTAAPFSTRSPIERAVLAFADSKFLTSEREFLARNEFKVDYIPFDWSLNDLTGRGGR